MLDMEPTTFDFHLRVDWTCWHAYPGDSVEVDLISWGRQPGRLTTWTGFAERLHNCATPEEAVAWARRWLEGRGYRWWCDVDERQLRNDTFVTLHPLAAAVQSAP